MMGTGAWIKSLQSPVTVCVVRRDGGEHRERVAKSRVGCVSCLSSLVLRGVRRSEFSDSTDLINRSISVSANASSVLPHFNSSPTPSHQPSATVSGLAPTRRS